MILSFANGYSFFLNDSRAYIHGPALVLKFVTGMDVDNNWPDNNVAPECIPAVSKQSDPAPPLQGGPAPSSGSSEIHKDRPYSVNRSVYYGALAFAGYLLSDFWATSFIQAYLVAVPAALLFLTCLGLSRAAYYLAILAISLLSTAGIFSALMMPDIFAGISILSAALLFVYWSDLRTFDRIFLGCTIAFAALCHGTIIAVLTALIALMAALSFLVPPVRRGRAAIAVCLAALIVGVAGMSAYDKALGVAAGHKPIVMPHILASLIYKGPGYAYLVAKCPVDDLVICNYVSKLPQYPDDFMGADCKNGVYATADLPTQIRLSEEQTRFAVGVLKFDPVGVAASFLKAGLEQAGFFPVESLKVLTKEMNYFNRRFPPDVAAKIENSKIARSPRWMDVVTIATYVTAVASMVVIAYFLFVLARTDIETRRLSIFNLVVLYAIIVNAFVCGDINTPVDRYQARVIWLLPLLALTDLAYRRATEFVPNG
jgi:hypothetical protein